MTGTTLTPPSSGPLSALNVGSFDRQVTPSVMQRLQSPFWNSLRITALMQEFSSRFQTDDSQPLDIFCLCIALSRYVTLLHTVTITYYVYLSIYLHLNPIWLPLSPSFSISFASNFCWVLIFTILGSV